jgi:hypothetical protein
MLGTGGWAAKLEAGAQPLPFGDRWPRTDFSVSMILIRDDGRNVRALMIIDYASANAGTQDDPSQGTVRGLGWWLGGGVQKMNLSLRGGQAVLAQEDCQQS